MVSIIIPTYNRSSLISETLDSIINQSYQDWECIVVDDGSQDRTVEEVLRYTRIDCRIKLYLRPNNLPKGANSCRNYGLIWAHGRYVKWLDSDDLLVSDCLFNQVAILEENNHINLCLGYSRLFDHKTKRLEEPWSRSFESNCYISDHINNRIRWGIGDVLWRRKWLGKSPFYNYLKNSQEWLMHSESLLLLNSDQIYNLRKIVCLIRRGNFSMSSDESTTYYLNQVKARLLLIRFNRRINRLVLADFICLYKQVLVYLFYAFKSFILLRIGHNVFLSIIFLTMCTAFFAGKFTF